MLGKWRIYYRKLEDGTLYEDSYNCSVCHWYNERRYKYCPHCGSKMVNYSRDYYEEPEVEGINEQVYEAMCDHCFRRNQCWEDDNQFCDEFLKLTAEEVSEEWVAEG